jgi:hypothetical protein
MYIYTMEQLSKELNKKAIRKFPRQSVIASAPNEMFQIDLIDMGERRKDGDYRYILMTIDIFSRKAWAHPLTSKNPKEVLQSFKKIDVKPLLLQVDEGGEFKGVFKKYFGKETKVYNTFSGMKAEFVERLNRTFKEMFQKEFTKKQRLDWVDVIPKITDEYNNNIQSSIGATPNEVYKKEKMPEHNEIKAKPIRYKFKIGDFVRISKTRGIFEKPSMTENWSHEVFEIYQISNTAPVTYHIKDLLGEEVKGKFYEQELQKTNLKDFSLIEKIYRTKKQNGKKLYYVKYKGYDTKFNEWVGEDQVENFKKS